ncbi:hypothetical protein I4U23_022903 [Adineta vaga]|nr:hypothetical protein I4U23_022903 [Adineta vaga]
MNDFSVLHLHNQAKKYSSVYANIKHLSYFREENEILIGLGSIFQIEEIFYDENEHIWILIGNIYQNLNDLDQALSYQEKALELLPEDHPSYPDIYSNMVQIYQNQEKYDLALE